MNKIVLRSGCMRERGSREDLSFVSVDRRPPLARARIVKSLNRSLKISIVIPPQIKKIPNFVHRLTEEEQNLRISKSIFSIST